jgi:hypothetical protein
MGSTTEYFCDRCKKKIGGRHTYNSLYVWRSGSLTYVSNHQLLAELCDDCWKGFQEFLKGVALVTGK